MTVNELIEKLRKFEGDMEVWYDMEYGFSEVKEVKLIPFPYPKDCHDRKKKDIVLLQY